MDEFFAYTVSGKFIMIRGSNWLFANCRRIVQGIVISWMAYLLLIWVHYNYNQFNLQARNSQFKNNQICIQINLIVLFIEFRLMKQICLLIIMKDKQKGNVKWYITITITILLSATVYFSSNQSKIQENINANRRLYTINTIRLPVVATYCSNSVATVIESSDRQKNSGFKSSLSSYFKANATRLVVDLVNNNYGDLMTEIQINGTGTLIFISPFVIGLFFLLITFPCLLCCCSCQQSCPPKCCKGKNPNYLSSQLTPPTVFVVLTCLLIIGTATASMTGSKSFFSDFNCQASKFIDDFYNGNPTSDQKYFFSGVTQVRYQLKSILSPKLNEVNTQIQKLQPLGGSVMGTLLADINSVLTNLKKIPRADSLQFTQTYSFPLDSSTASGRTFSTVLGPFIGTYGVDTTLLGSLYKYITALNTNMSTIANSASSVVPHLNSADMGTEITVADVVLAGIQGNLDSLYSQLKNLMSLLSSIDKVNTTYSIVFYGVILGQAVLILLAVVFVKCLKAIQCRYFIYFICLIMLFFCIMLFLYAIILSVIMPTLFYTCSYFENTFISPTAFKDTILTLQGDSYADLANKFSQCFGGTNNFMTAVNPTLQGYITQLQNSVFNSYQYDFTAMSSSINSQLGSMELTIDNYGLGHLPDFDVTSTDGMTQINTFNSIANKSAFSSGCPQASFNVFYQDVWVPGLSSTYQTYVSCLNKLGLDSTTCGTNLPNLVPCPSSRCYDTFSMISAYYRVGATVNIVNDANSRYGTCASFGTYLTDFKNKYVKLVVDNIGNSAQDSTDVNKLAGRFNTYGKIPVNNLKASMNGNVKTLFTQVYDNLTQTNNLLSIFDPSKGVLTGLDCRLLSEDGVNAKDALCITSYNQIYFTLVTVAILAFATFLALCCIVCFNVRHYRHSIQKQKNPGRIVPLDQTSSQIQMK